MESLTLYSAVVHTPSYEFSTWKCIGIFDSFDKAKDALINHLFINLVEFNVYDPAKRFEKREVGILKEKNIWIDRWLNTLGVSRHYIEVWDVNTSKSPKEILYFNFDNYFKTYIENHVLDSKHLKFLLKSWKQNQPYDLMKTLFSTSEVSFQKSYAEKNIDLFREIWQARYGSKKPYPYGDDDLL